jgi:hypothetical protein
LGEELIRCYHHCTLGGGKYLDPNKGWTYNAKPLPALDTYTRHTLGAQYIYGILGPEGLRLLTPTVVYIELLSAPLAFLGCYLGNATLVKVAIAMICQLHLGISFTLGNAALLSYAACAAWCVFLPIGWEAAASAPAQRSSTTTTKMSKVGFVVSALFVGAMAGGNVWFETIGDCSTGSLSSIWSTLLQNHWNVFVGAEE